MRRHWTCLISTASMSSAGGSNRGSSTFTYWSTMLVKRYWFVSNDTSISSLLTYNYFVAGINYASQDLKPTPTHPLRSKQGYDLQFASNYLGHFLLTDLLLPVLKTTPQARVLQVSSNSHYFPSGADLSTSGGRLIPPAAEVLPQKSSPERDIRWRASYGNSKLAQVMHAIELQKVLAADPSTDLKVYTRVCIPMFPPQLPALDLCLNSFMCRYFHSRLVSLTRGWCLIAHLRLSKVFCAVCSSPLMLRSTPP